MSFSSAAGGIVGALWNATGQVSKPLVLTPLPALPSAPPCPPALKNSSAKPASATSSSSAEPTEVVATARYDFDGFGGQLSFRRGDEIVLVDYPSAAPTTSTTTTATPIMCSASPSWCLGKRAMDDVKGIVYLPALKLTSSATLSSPNNSAWSSGLRQGYLPSWSVCPRGPKRDEVVRGNSDEQDGRKAITDQDMASCCHGEAGQNAVTKKKPYTLRILGFLIVFFVALFILVRWQAGWILALLGFMPRLLALFDSLVHRYFL